MKASKVNPRILILKNDLPETMTVHAYTNVIGPPVVSRLRVLLSELALVYLISTLFDDAWT